LIELMVVLLILVALAGIVIPKMSNYISKAHDGAAVANVSTLISSLENYRANHLYQGYPDKWDSLCAPSSGATWSGVPVAAQQCLAPLALDCQTSQALISAGIVNLMDSSTLDLTVAGTNATFSLPTTVVPVSTGTYVMEIQETSGSAGLAAIQLNVPNPDVVNYHYVLLGLGDSCSIVGSDIAQAPVHFDTIDPQVYYQHYAAIFAVPVTGGTHRGNQATLATVVGVHDGGLSGLLDHMNSYDQSNK
jgi:type II secretory pathway pseudopilin PulG